MGWRGASLLCAQRAFAERGVESQRDSIKSLEKYTAENKVSIDLPIYFFVLN